MKQNIGNTITGSITIIKYDDDLLIWQDEFPKDIISSNDSILNNNPCPVIYYVVFFPILSKHAKTRMSQVVKIKQTVVLTLQKISFQKTFLMLRSLQMTGF